MMVGICGSAPGTTSVVFLQIGKGRLALLDERGHALLLVLERKRLVKEALLRETKMGSHEGRKGCESVSNTALCVFTNCMHIA